MGAYFIGQHLARLSASAASGAITLDLLEKRGCLDYQQWPKHELRLSVIRSTIIIQLQPIKATIFSRHMLTFTTNPRYLGPNVQE